VCVRCSIRPASPLGQKPGYLLADKGYDTNAIRDRMKDDGVRATIPSKSNRVKEIRWNKALYRERNRHRAHDRPSQDQSRRRNPLRQARRIVPRCVTRSRHPQMSAHGAHGNFGNRA
jgi:IS5 family transposase